MLLATITFRIQPHKRAEALSAVDALVERMRSASGCGRGRVLSDSEDQNICVVASEWNDANAAEAFLGSRVRALVLKLADKDEYTEEHTRRVAMLGVQVGEELGLPPVRLRSLATGGLLHDIGKLAVPDSILKKPGALDDDEFAVIRRHPEWGHHLLGQLGDFSADIRRLVLDHHERLDGSGYPRGLTQAQLDLETRILAVCDVYDALISNRVYRAAWSHERAMELLYEGAGDLFDRRCVDALDRVLARLTELPVAV